MRFYLLPAVAAAALMLSGAAFASETATGAIKAFDMKAGTLTLADGTIYMLPKGFKDPGLKVGEKVSVAWTMSGAKHDATEVKIVK